MKCERVECLEICKDGSSLLLKAECDAYLIKLEGEYYVTATVPGNKVVRMKTKELLAERKELKANDVLKFDMEVEPIGASITAMFGEKVVEREILF